MLLVLATALFTLSACEDSGMDKQKVRGDEYFRNAKALYVIDGQHYAVPMGYRWDVHIKLRQWPTPKSTFLETTSFTVFALLPDMLPYSEATKEKFDNRRGHGDVVDIMVQSNSQRKRPIADLLKEWKKFERLVRLPDNSDVPGLLHYVDRQSKYAKQDDWRDVYVPEDIENAKFWIRCVRGVPAPGCSVYDITDSPDMPYLDYSFDIKYLSRYREIRQRVASLVASFKTKKPDTK